MADDAIVRIKLDGSGARLEAGKTNAAVKGVGTSADGANKSMLNLSSVAAGVVTALATSKIIQYADAWTNVNNRLKAATNNTRELAIAQSGVLSIAQEAGVELGSVADAYSRISQSTSELGVSQERVLDVTRKVTLALKAGGATGAETSSTMIQLGQALGSGALQGDELRSILEASIPISKALAKEFDTNVGSLKALGAEGKLTSERVVSAIENMDASALTFTKDISSGFTTVSNALTVYVGKVDESLGVSSALGGALSDLSKNIQLAIDIAGALAFIIGAKYVGAVTAAIASNLSLAASSLRATTTINAMGTVIARTTVLMNAQALAARGAGAAMAFLGGPIGVAVIAAGALIYFAEQAETAKERSERLAGEVDNLTASFKGLTDLQRQIKLTNISNEFNETQLLLTEASKKLELFKGFAESPIKTENVRKYQGEVERLGIKLDELSVKQQALFSSGLPADSEFTDLTGSSDSSKPVASEGASSSAPENTGLTEKLERENQMIQDSLLARQNIYSQYYQSANDAYGDQYERQRAQLELSIAEEMLQEEENFQQKLQTITDRNLVIQENKSINNVEKHEAEALLREQAILLEQEFEEKKTQIAQTGNAQRADLETASLNSRLDAWSGFANSTLGLMSAFGIKSNKLQKGFAIADAVVNIASGVAKALNNPYPANLGFAAQVAVQGAGLLATIKGASTSTSTTPSISSSSSSSSTTPSAASTASTQTNTTKRIIDLRGFESGGFLTREQLTELLAGDEDVIIASNNGQKQGVRVGAINNG